MVWNSTPTNPYAHLINQPLRSEKTDLIHSTISQSGEMTLIKIYSRFEKYNVEVIIYGVTQVSEVACVLHTKQPHWQSSTLHMTLNTLLLNHVWLFTHTNGLAWIGLAHRHIK